MKLKTKHKEGPKEPTKADAMMPEPFINALDSLGVDEAYLAKRLKRELNAKETKAQIPKGEMEFSYSKPLIAWDIRQKARQDAHKLRADYPAEKLEVEVKKLIKL